MSVPRESGHDDQQLVRYLLGLLPDDETERLDELSISDDDVASRLRVVEHDLIDTYVRGTMADDERARFEAVYLSSAHRRQKVRFAESFLGTVDRSTAAPDGADGHLTDAAPSPHRPEPSPRGLPPGRSASPSMKQRGLAIAAALVLVAGAGLLLRQAQLRSGLQEARSTSAEWERRAEQMERQFNDQRAANAEMEQELQRARASLAEAAQRSSATTAEQPAAASNAAAMVALVLPPQTRGAGAIATLAVPRGAAGVAFELQLEANDFPQYQVALRDPAADRVVWRSSRVPARLAGDLPLIAVVVPAEALQSQQYSIELTGYAADGAERLVSSAPVRIVRR